VKPRWLVSDAGSSSGGVPDGCDDEFEVPAVEAGEGVGGPDVGVCCDAYLW
jgi:hypothetical protein